MEEVRFQDSSAFREAAESLFLAEKAKLLAVLPEADIQHVGSTSLPRGLTKGDLDIQVRVRADRFAEAVVMLSSLYERNEGSSSTEHFRAFKDDGAVPPLGIQLTVAGSETDFFWKFREVLARNESYLQEYDSLKRRYDGCGMDEYRAEKNAFFERLMTTEAFKELD
ncbi:GrpB family protein [Paenibacillus humicus]|uniref:GrpB family protein n=1 Tax=Paenibacillus humicus TaxID=412861 RepID=UPI000FD809B9|nr:GrpB family protein [Paenibacillus humicus]